MDRRQLAQQQMEDYDLLRQAMMMQQQQEANFAPIQQKYEDVTTARYNKGLMGAGEAIFDAVRRKKVEPQYQQELTDVLAGRSGVDDIRARLEMLQQEREVEEERAYEQSQADAEHNRKTTAQQALQTQKDTSAMERTKARGNSPNLTYNIPAGYMPVDPNNPMGGVVPIPGGPAEQEAAEANRKATGRTAQTQRAGTTVVQDLGRGLQLMQQISQGEGIAGANLRVAKSQIAGTPEYQVLQFKESALSNVGLDTLQQMRENSPTGGALGQVPIQQQKRLEQVLGSLELGQKPSDIEANMQRIMNIYTDIMYGAPEERALAISEGRLTQEESDAVEQRYFQLPFDDMGRPSGGESEYEKWKKSQGLN